MDLLIAKKREKKKELFEESAFRIEYIKGTKFSIKRLAKKNKDSTILFSADLQENECPYIKAYEGDIFFEALPVLERILILTAKKYNITLPAKEIYIFASPENAALIIEQIKDFSRLFTVVSKNEENNKLYDELYFKHGVVVRQTKTINLNSDENSLIIKYKENIPITSSFPIITFDSECFSKKCVKIGEAYVSDERLSLLERCLKQNGSFYMYKMLGIKPDDKSRLSLDKKGNKMFFLDISEI